jgi:hypothetical protein
VDLQFVHSALRSLLVFSIEDGNGRGGGLNETSDQKTAITDPNAQEEHNDIQAFRTGFLQFEKDVNFKLDFYRKR